MKIKIHRGTDEIGGSCVEISTVKTRILIDIGEQLEPVNKKKSPPNQTTPQDLPASLTESLKEDLPIKAILISHAHRDHFGLLPLLPASIPIHMSEGSKIMIHIAEYFKQITSVPQKIHTFPFEGKFRIGDFSVTPILADHSAMDACSFLISVGEQRVFYSGDIRAHGRKKVMFDRLVSNPPADIDALVLEGTTLGRPQKGIWGELELEEKFVKLFRSTKKFCMVSFSSQNIDRLVTVYRACVKTGKTLVIDPYTAKILESAHAIHDKVPNWDWPNIGIFYTENSYTDKIKADSSCAPMKSAEITLNEIRKRRASLVMKLNYKNRFILKKMNMLPGSILIWSQWSEYFRQEEDFWTKNGIKPIYLHVSGHAYEKDLKRLVNSMKPDCIIPIHTQYKKDYPVVFAPTPVKILEDGEDVDI